MVLRDPPGLRWSDTGSELKVARQERFADDRDEGCYVLFAADVPGQGYLVGGSNDQVKLYDKQLKRVSTVKVAKGVTSLFGTADGAGFFTTHRNGTLQGYDLRTPATPVMSLSNANARVPWLCGCQSSDGSTLAVGSELSGSDVTVSIFDLRNASQQVHTYTEGHSDDITCLAFHPDPALAHVLLSGSVDGLVNTCDVRIADEDDAIEATCQVGASVASAGWMPSPATKAVPWTGVYAATTVETIQAWDVNSQDMLYDTGDARDVCLQPWRTDYIVSLRHSLAFDALCFFAGTQDGSMAIINLSDPKMWSLEHVLAAGPRGGHNDIVRTAIMDETAGTCLTGSEDGTVCVWTRYK